MMRWAYLGVAWIIVSPAHAEVCDKIVGEWWRPEHGPVDITIPGMPLGWISAEGWKLAIFALVILTLWIAKVRAREWIACCVLSIAALHSLLIWALYRNDGEGMIEAGVREGCLSPQSSLVSGPTPWIFLAWSLSAIGLALLLRSRGSRAAPTAA